MEWTSVYGKRKSSLHCAGIRVEFKRLLKRMRFHVKVTVSSAPDNPGVVCPLKLCNTMFESLLDRLAFKAAGLFSETFRVLT